MARIHALLLAMAVVGCSYGGDSNDVARSEGGCRVTIANGQTPPGEAPAAEHHGNGSVWTVLPPKSVVRPTQVQADGSRSEKFPWWIARYSGLATIDEELKVSGRRIDGAAPPLGVHLPCCYSGGFQASSLSFREPGCWRVTARSVSGGEPLVFTVRVEF